MKYITTILILICTLSINLKADTNAPTTLTGEVANHTSVGGFPADKGAIVTITGITNGMASVTYKNRQANIPVSKLTQDSVDAYTTKYANEHPSHAIQDLTDRANKGDISSQIYLGMFYKHGEGVPENANTAIAWFRKAADQGDFCGQRNLACMLMRPGKNQNREEAKALLIKAAAQADPWSREILMKSFGIPEDQLPEIR